MRTSVRLPARKRNAGAKPKFAEPAGRRDNPVAPIFCGRMRTSVRLPARKRNAGAKPKFAEPAGTRDNPVAPIFCDRIRTLVRLPAPKRNTRAKPDLQSPPARGIILSPRFLLQDENLGWTARAQAQREGEAQICRARRQAG